MPFPSPWRRLNTLLSEAIEAEKVRRDGPVTGTALGAPAASARLDARHTATDRRCPAAPAVTAAL